MQVRALDPNGDYTLTNSSSEFLSNSPAAVAQCIQTALALWQGQWFLDTSAGVGWSTEILGKYPAALYDSVIKDAILNVIGVQSITSYSSTYNAQQRSLTVNANVQTIYGSTAVAVAQPLVLGYGVGPLGENPLGF